MELATESLLAAEGDPLADQAKSRWSKQSCASNRSVSEIIKESTENSQVIIVVEINWREVSTESLLAELKEVWQDEVHLSVGAHNIVKRQENMDCLITEEKYMKVWQLHQTFKLRKNSV